ncbi:unnamed protein product [Lymnaea stagnalis]|uniref:Uncharacterized protein n=1 Tax=Lymnaea stagnalis TaxID=6523 RepID=A0AAV2HJ94_LYMST
MKQPNLLFIMSVNCALISKLTLCECTSLSSLCQPAEEGHRSSIVLRKSFHQQNIIITVERFNYTIARCNFPGNCRDFFPKEFSTKLHVNNTSFDVTITVTVFNTSREIEKYWNLVHKKIVSTCNVLVFARARIISCSEAISKEGLHIACWSSSIYPEANALLSVTSPRLDKSMSGSFMNCVNEKLPGDPTYYRPNCSLTLSVDKLIPGQYDVLLTLYPNVTGNATDQAFGTNHSFHVILDFTQLKDYTKIIEKNTSMKYSCERSNSELLKITSNAFDGNNVNGEKPRTRQTKKEAYFCVETGALGLAKAFYSPTTLTKNNSLNCTTAEVEGKLLVTCTSHGIHPLGLCQIMINKTVQKISRNTNVNNVEITPDNDTTYWSSCEFNITKSELSQGHYDILVTMYPNVTGDDSDKQFASNQSISVNLANEFILN